LTKANNVAVGGRAKFPGIAVPERLDARFKPFRFTNAKAKELLDWTPRYDLATALDRSIEVQNAVEHSG
jgi:nucleoside-diphosphate-sugar epimerase